MTNSRTEHGFLLQEAAIALVVFGILALVSLQQYRVQETLQKAQRLQRDEADIREHVLGFLVTQGRLPCPAPAGGQGQENCTLIHGELPWATLGVGETDPWGNRYLYFAASAFTRAPGPGVLAGFDLETGVAPNNAGLANIRNLSVHGGQRIAIDIAAVIVSRGALASARSSDEQENQDNDLEFVSDAESPGFDDRLFWFGPALLKSRLLSVGKLP